MKTKLRIRRSDLISITNSGINKYTPICIFINPIDYIFILEKNRNKRKRKLLKLIVGKPIKLKV